MANSGGYYTFLFLFILGVVCGSINQIGIWNVAEPATGYSVSNDQIANLQNTAVNNSPIGIFVIYVWIVAFLTVIGSGILAVFSVGLLFYGMGWPVGPVGAALLTMIQAPATLQALFWLFELWTGR
jgi:uncharacterized membrane protein